MSAAKDAAIRYAHAREQYLKRAPVEIMNVTQQATQVTQIKEDKDGRSEQRQAGSQWKDWYL